MATFAGTPTTISGHSPTELLLKWNLGEQPEESYAIPYVEMRFACPCAGCVDEHTGQRTLKRENIQAEIKPRGAQVVGQYAVQFNWNDGHDTGIFHFDRLYKLSREFGRRLS